MAEIYVVNMLDEPCEIELVFTCRVALTDSNANGEFGFLCL
jgi:hypothetical protein